MSPSRSLRISAPRNLDEIVSWACREAGLSPAGFRLIRHYANAVYLLPEVSTVVRVARGPGAVHRSRVAVGVTRWLVGHRFPATSPAPLPTGRTQPLVLTDEPEETAVTFWRYYPQPADGAGLATEHLAEVARRLHQYQDEPPVALAKYQPLELMRQLVSEPVAAAALSPADLRWLTGRIDLLRASYDGLDSRLGTGLLHGDLYLGNLLCGGSGAGGPVAGTPWRTGAGGYLGRGTRTPVLADWDTVCLGPREVDLAPTYAAVRFGLDPGQVDRFAAAYGYDLRTWSGWPVLRAIREVSTLSALIQLAPSHPEHATELRHRMRCLRTGDQHSRWNPR